MNRSRIAGIILLFSVSLYGCQAAYIGRLGYHQLRFIIARQPVEKVLNESSLSNNQKDKIKLILAARSFAEQGIGLKATENYTQYVQLDRNILAYILTAAPKDRLESKQWRFPIVGSFPYKGFFDRQALEKERARLEQEEGLDTFVQFMSAYSTLGWFLDPIFSTYLEMEDHDLADMVIHESVHLTLFMKGNMAFNEQMATFLGRMGAIKFLEHYRGQKADATQGARDRWADDLIFAQWMKQLVADLQKLYEKDITKDEKIRHREFVFKHYNGEFHRLIHQLRTDEYLWLRSAHLNNALILAMRTYMDHMELFFQAHEMLNRDLARLVELLKKVCQEEGDPIHNLRRLIEARSKASFLSRNCIYGTQYIQLIGATAPSPLEGEGGGEGFFLWGRLSSLPVASHFPLTPQGRLESLPHGEGATLMPNCIVTGFFH